LVTDLGGLEFAFNPLHRYNVYAMSQTLYRKYRPQFFAELVGQDHIRTTLQNQIASGKLAHAYLFCGMRGVGKTTVARLFAKSVNCENRKNGDNEPCGKCESCVAIASGHSLDLIEIDAASNRRIDDVREIREHLPVGPVKSRYKVVIVDEVHMMTTEAFNALLKTLEEPPAHVIFILATTEVHKVPDTILSRCQRFDFRRLSVIDLIKRLETLVTLEKVKVEPEVLKQIAQLAGGSTRDAESYLGKILSLDVKNITQKEASLVLPHSDINSALSLVEYLINRRTSEAVALVNKFLEEGGELSTFHKQVLEIMRKLLLIKLGGALPSYANIELTPEQEAGLVNLSREITYSRLQDMLQNWLNALENWRQSELLQLPTELAIVMICENKREATDSSASIPSQSPKIEDKADKKETSLPKIDSSSPITLSQISEHWNEIVVKLRDFNHSLSFVLSVAKPIKLEGKSLTIAFQYKLHQERVNDHKIKEVIQKVLHDVFTTDFVIKTIVNEDKETQGDLLTNILSTFGGQVVE
jgi:DNA polymerase III subunit gamma/tau